MENRSRSIEEIQLPSDINNSSHSILYSLESSPNPSLNTVVTFGSSNVFGPISFTQMRLLSNLIYTKKKPEKVEEPKVTGKNDDDGDKFLMKPPPEIEDASQENIEVQRAERSKFVQMMTLATIQDKTFQP